ncbi:unnamed protein product [Prorocentrum cordatum]|uniref:Uncharacterized protein n=1 Tax=Prorocentrum cordatum TaxID=2364126 RepID=A0ABN9PH29_9DINO|nr:unnamed protein product [Polarella glacialis]
MLPGETRRFWISADTADRRFGRPLPERVLPMGPLVVDMTLRSIEREAVFSYIMTPESRKLIEERENRPETILLRGVGVGVQFLPWAYYYLQSAEQADSFVGPGAGSLPRSAIKMPCSGAVPSHPAMPARRPWPATVARVQSPSAPATPALRAGLVLQGPRTPAVDLVDGPAPGEGYAGKHEVTWKELSFVPKKRAVQLQPVQAAWATAARWARHLRSVSQALHTFAPRLEVDDGDQARRFRRIAKVLVDADSAITLSGLLDAYAREALWQEALGALADALGGEALCDLILCNTAVAACGRAARWREALGLLEAMPGWRYRPDASARGITCNTALGACSRAAEWSAAVLLLRDMPRRRLRADAVSFSTCITAGHKAGRWDLAAGLLADMRGRRVAPNIITFNASVTALTAGQQWESAVSLLGDMQEVRLQTCARTVPPWTPCSTPAGASRRRASTAGRCSRGSPPTAPRQGGGGGEA